MRHRQFYLNKYIQACMLLCICMTSLLSTLKEKPKEDERLPDLEKRLSLLQKRLDSEYLENNELLAAVKQHLGRIENKRRERINGNTIKIPHFEPTIAVLVLVCDRVTVKRCLDQIMKYRPNRKTFPLIVSQDCGHKPTYDVIEKYKTLDPTMTIVQQPDQSDVMPRAKVRHFEVYHKIARHYRFALNYVFRTLGYETVIVVEDDLDIASDFFEYFLATYRLMKVDPSIWCVSAWNDNGNKELIELARPELLHRTDFFPGLGWMLRRSSWLALEPEWPRAFYDNWLRDPYFPNTCIRPEISRTYTFGKKGASGGIYYDTFLKNIHLNSYHVEFTKQNLTYLIKENYDEAFIKTVYDAPETCLEQLKMLPEDGYDVRLMYKTAKEYEKIAREFGLMSDLFNGIPRTAYKGVVTCFIGGRRVYIAPGFEWTALGYETILESSRKI